MNLNKVTIAGNLTRDPELRYLPKGTAVCNIGVAINREWKGEDGQKKKETTFVDIDLFGRIAEAVAQYLKKGKPIYVEGRLKLDEWEDKPTGTKRQKLKIIGESFQFVGGKDDSGVSAPSAPKPTEAVAPAAASDPQPDEDDVPF